MKTKFDTRKQVEDLFLGKTGHFNWSKFVDLYPEVAAELVREGHANEFMFFASAYGVMWEKGILTIDAYVVKTPGKLLDVACPDNYTVIKNISDVTVITIQMKGFGDPVYISEWWEQPSDKVSDKYREYKTVNGRAEGIKSRRVESMSAGAYHLVDYVSILN